MRTKAQSYHVHPSDLKAAAPFTRGNCHDGVKVLLIESSAMDKVIERAAKAIARADGLSWRHRGPTQRAFFIEAARAAYRAGGFVS